MIILLIPIVSRSKSKWYKAQKVQKYALNSKPQALQILKNDDEVENWSLSSFFLAVWTTLLNQTENWKTNVMLISLYVWWDDVLGYIERTPKNTIEKFRTSFLPPSTQILPYLAQRSGQPYVPIFHIPWMRLHSEFASYICKAKIHIVEKYGSKNMGANYPLDLKPEKILGKNQNFRM